MSDTGLNRTNTNQAAAQTADAAAVARIYETLPHDLPAIDNTERANFDKLFVSMGICGSTNLLGTKVAPKNEPDKVSEFFVTNTLNDYVIHIQKFVTAMKRFQAAAPVEFQELIGKAPNMQLRVLEVTNGWDVSTPSNELTQLQFSPNSVYIEKLIPLVFFLYRSLFRMMFISESDFNILMDKTYTELRDRVTAPQQEFKALTEEAKYEWSFITRNVLRGLYPLLMRICSSYCVTMQEFLNDNVQRILRFFNLKREDIVIPSPFQPVVYPEKPKTAESSTTAYGQAVRDTNQMVQSGLELLNRLFPEAGWLRLEKNPDMYPYFQPLFNFSEGFNLLSPQNPMQVAVVLMRIIEDLIPGCTTMKLPALNGDASTKMSAEEVARALDDWYLARMNVFDKEYAQELTDYVNRIYSQKEFRNTASGMKKLSSILQLQKSEFFPYLKFGLSYMENDKSAYGSQPVYKKVARFAKYFGWLSGNVTKALEASGGKPTGLVSGIENPWSKYTFTIGNVISHRLDVLFGAKSVGGQTNANLIVVIAKIFAVLDWWMNNMQSHSYAAELEIPYRADALTGEPIFSCPLRNDVDYIFMRENRKK